MIPKINCRIDNAAAWTEGDSLIVTTGSVRRAWAWTGGGFTTREVSLADSPLSWKSDEVLCDWQLPDTTEPTDAEIQSLTAEVSDDEGFTSRHVSVTAVIGYPKSGFTLKWSVWAYPQGPGIRTHLQASRTGDESDSSTSGLQGGSADARVDRVPTGPSSQRRRYFGYYNETQQRNDTHQDLLKEDVVEGPVKHREWCSWASAACVETDAGGIALVKESHRCVNQRGVAGGEFIVDGAHWLECNGWGLGTADLSADAFTPGWATWTIAWAGGDIERQLAFKRFDRARYPIDPARDIYIQANTWGSTSRGTDARRAAAEPSVLKEIEICAEMGIDVLQIDDGWQTPLGSPSWQTGDDGWRPHKECYPDGWKNVRDLAAKLNVKLGLWAAAEPVSLDELKATFTEGNFFQYKLDFANLKTRGAIDALMNKVRAFIKWTGHRVRVNWDVTENPARYGYFFAREYGPIYLENRKFARPRSTIYRPHTVLRDLWQAAKYLNLHRVQGSIQNVDHVDQGGSDAFLHSHQYATAVALMSIPLFFCETKYFSVEAKAQIGSLLSTYKQHRERIYRGIVHPIGDKPDNYNWTGFQCHIEEENCGYMTVFRELCNADAKQSIRLARVPNRSMRINDLLTGRSWEQAVGNDGTIVLEIAAAPGFLFLRYD